MTEVSSCSFTSTCCMYTKSPGSYYYLSPSAACTSSPNSFFLPVISGETQARRRCYSHYPWGTDLALTRMRPHFPGPIILQEDIRVSGQDTDLE